MYVDLFPTLRMKRDILEAKRNLRKVSLSNSAESVIGQEIRERKLTRMNSVSYESVLRPEVVSPKTKKRFKHAFSKLVQNFGRSSSKPDLRKEECGKDDLSGYSYPVTLIETRAKKPTDEGYDRLQTWSPFIAAEKDNFNRTCNPRNEGSGLDQERRYQLPIIPPSQERGTCGTPGQGDMLNTFEDNKRKLSTEKIRHRPSSPACKVSCDEMEQKLVGTNKYTQLCPHDHVTMHCRRQNLTVRHLENKLHHVLHKA